MSLWDERNWGPMLLKEIDKPFDDKNYIYEIKYDGFRALCFVNNKEISFLSRNHVDMTKFYPELKDIRKLVKKNVIFDGEIIALDENGKPSFSNLQNRSRLKDKKKILNYTKSNPVTFVAFDILYENKDLTNLSLIERKEKLSHYKDTDVFVKARYIEEKGKKLFAQIKKNDLEGIVAKNKNSVYHINERTDDFIKIKNIKRGEFVIGGYEIKERNISLLLGEFQDETLLFVGKCSVNKNHEDVKNILALEKKKNCFANCNNDGIFVKPVFYCYIDYTEKTKSGNLRHPVFKGIIGVIK